MTVCLLAYWTTCYIRDYYITQYTVFNSGKEQEKFRFQFSFHSTIRCARKQKPNVVKMFKSFAELLSGLRKCTGISRFWSTENYRRRRYSDTCTSILTSEAKPARRVDERVTDGRRVSGVLRRRAAAEQTRGGQRTWPLPAARHATLNSGGGRRRFSRSADISASRENDRE